MGCIPSKPDRQKNPSEFCCSDLHALGCIPSKPDRQKNPSVAAELSTYYSEACRLEPEFRSLESILQRSTSRVISALAADAALRSLSLKSLQEVTDGFADVSRNAFDTIFELKDDFSNNPDLLAFVREYFKNNVDFLKFFAAVREGLKRSRETEAIVRDALEQLANGNYSATLDKLREFKAAGAPFNETFVNEFRSVRKQQKSMLDRLRVEKRKLDKKLGSIKAWHRVWSIMFAVAFAAVLICSVVLAAVSAPPAATAAAAAASAAAPPLSQWFESFWDKYETALKGQEETAAALHEGTFFTIHELENIRLLVQRLEVHVETLLRNATSAIGKGDEAEVAPEVEQIKSKLVMLTKSVNDLDEEVERCSNDLLEVMASILKAVLKES